MDTDTAREWLSKQEAADRLGLTTVTVGRLIGSGKLTTITLKEGEIRISAASIEALKADQAKKAEAESSPLRTAYEIIRAIYPTVRIALLTVLIGGMAVGVINEAVMPVLDKHGWIAHNREVPVWISGEWIVGEYRECGMLSRRSSAQPVQPTPDVAGPRLFCGVDWDGKGIDEFELAMPDPAGATDAISGNVDWGRFQANFHTLPVLFHGPMSNPDAVFTTWHCQRKADSLECAARN